ncbi:uncharacterized protein JN550_000584 [Neoarthrinium moseri]|uniref:uncharacterized protein n=1 Tax=Neoarthrinium moseri TaxID=1658444 RepID=UPI001FDB6CCF|nr:uncharacterized protein JN550_000584 [Neoarthrinium moseri]KAI1878402.1 hypothetical protein JN550_000584 [Neoarthrinium moseri]
MAFSTANCRFEHPGAAPNPFSQGGGNRFNALSSGGGGSGGGGRADGTYPYKITKDAIKIDLLDERPQWILSSYGPGRDAPEQLFGGFPREQSFEEIRLSFLTSANPQQTLQEVQGLYQQAEHQIQTSLNNLDGAVQFVLAAENKHPNRIDVCRESSRQGGSTGAFAVGNTSSGFSASPFQSAPSATANPFAAASQPSPFGAPASAAPTTGAFGQPSQLGAKPNPFGQPAQTGGSAFGQTSALGAKPNPFGQPAQTGGAAFGQTSALGAKPNPFAAAASGPSGFAAAASQGSAFGQPSALGAKPNPFAAASGNATPSPFGAASQASPFGAQSQPQNASPFGAPSQPQSASPFGGAAQNQNASPFGAPSQPQGNSAFGAPSQPASGGFGAPSQASSGGFGAPSQPSGGGFGAPSQPSAAPANPFGQPAQPSGFATSPAVPNPFAAASNATATPATQAMDTSTPAAPSNPFGQPMSNGFANPSNNAFTQAAANQPAQADGAKNPYPPDSGKQHPDVNSYVARMGNRIIRFKNQPVAYQDGKPGVQGSGGQWSKIWFPNGPPSYYAATEIEDKSVYTDAIRQAYAESGRSARFTGDMPEVPPLREDCVWDF